MFDLLFRAVLCCAVLCGMGCSWYGSKFTILELHSLHFEVLCKCSPLYVSTRCGGPILRCNKVLDSRGPVPTDRCLSGRAFCSFKRLVLHRGYISEIDSYHSMPYSYIHHPMPARPLVMCIMFMYALVYHLHAWYCIKITHFQNC